MKKILLPLIATISCASLMAMRMEDTDIATPVQQLLINIDDIEPYNQRSFSELIEEEHAANQPYLFARIDTEDTPDKPVRNKYSHYVDATALNKMLTQNTQSHFQPSESVKNPVNNLLIKNIAYYMITKESKNTHSPVCTYDEFSDPVTRWNKLFRHNQLLISNAAGTSRAAGLLQLQAIAREMDSSNTTVTITSPAYRFEDRGEITGFTAAPSRSVQETTSLMDNQASRNCLENHCRDCFSHANNCCDHVHDCCYCTQEKLCNYCCVPSCMCVGYSLCAGFAAVILSFSLALDTTCLPWACVRRPCIENTNPNRNDVFCPLTRGICSEEDPTSPIYILNCTRKSCCGVNITLSSYSTWCNPGE